MTKIDTIVAIVHSGVANYFLYINVDDDDDGQGYRPCCDALTSNAYMRTIVKGNNNNKNKRKKILVFSVYSRADTV